MRVVKVNTVAYDPQSRTLSFSGLNRFSRPKEVSLFIEDEIKLIEVMHQLVASSVHTSINLADELKTAKKQKKTKSLQKPKKIV
ncbi:hypothetical protein CES85_4509 [Ochrobactrum quorumnocens]|uniref:Uncharacterized protein n=1 Tax=Ochrobactrum quorumnocens TaxID=271865 RepID=A0A248UAN3_9HYPH|nr:hypothetical protein [[Ochrobactrum] quorumnocens]ASV83726.1 hypothetical protein CES85_4509 [[Ochrobactrum] quorumnocens]